MSENVIIPKEDFDYCVSILERVLRDNHVDIPLNQDIRKVVQTLNERSIILERCISYAREGME